MQLLTEPPTSAAPEPTKLALLKPTPTAPSPHYFTLTVNPDAEHEWQRLTLVDPLSNSIPDLSKLVAEAVGQSGIHVVAVTLSVEVLATA